MLVVEDVYYIRFGVECYFINVWVFIFNTNCFEDFLAVFGVFIMILMSLVWIFRISADMNLSVLFGCIVVICCLMELVSGRWYVRRRDGVVVVWSI